MMRVPMLMHGLPFTSTRPALMSSSQARREPTAQDARYLLRRVPSLLAMRINTKGAKSVRIRAF